MDLFAQLPNEVLQEVFQHVPSLPEKFKLAAVNQKFRGAIMKIMGKPMDLVMNFEEKTINGVQIPHNKLPMAVEVLAERTYFEEIRIHRSSYINTGFLDAIRDILIKTDSLTQATAFESDLVSGAMVERLLKECPKLSQVFLLSAISRISHPTAFNVDLSVALGGRAITNLRLKLEQYPLAELSTFFKSLQPNTLKQCSLVVGYPLDLVQLVHELSGSAWAALEDLEMSITQSSGTQLQLLELVATRLPRLRKCSISFQPFGMHDTTIILAQFANALVSMFKGRTQSAQAALDFFYSDARLGMGLGRVSGCTIVDLIGRIRQKHPELHFEHGEHLGGIELTLANLTFTCFDDVVACHNGCLECRSFFPVIIIELNFLAENKRRNKHLKNHQLDRCMVGRVVEAMNSLNPNYYKALSAVANEAQSLATITLETTNGRQFHITAACDRCFNSSCLKCLVV